MEKSSANLLSFSLVFTCGTYRRVLKNFVASFFNFVSDFFFINAKQGDVAADWGGG